MASRDVSEEIAEMKTDLKWIKEKLDYMAEEYSKELRTINGRVDDLEIAKAKIYGTIFILFSSMVAVLGARIAGLL